MSSLLAYYDDSYILGVMEEFLESPYAYGGKNGPAVMPFSIISGHTDVRGYDCSGYAQIVLRILGAIGHGVPWMSAQSMYDASTKISESSAKPGDCVFYTSNGSSICHVTLYAGPGLIIGANSGGSSTFADDPDARVKYGENYWQSAIAGYGTYRGGYGLDMDDYIVSFALYMARLKGYRSLSELPAGIEGWERFQTIMGSALDGNYSHTGSELYETFMQLNDGVSTWDAVVDTLTGVAGAAYAEVVDWIDGSGDGSDAEEEAAEEEGDGSWASQVWEWAWGDDEAEAKAEGKEEAEEAEEAEEDDDDGWWFW